MNPLASIAASKLGKNVRILTRRDGLPRASYYGVLITVGPVTLRGKEGKTLKSDRQYITISRSDGLDDDGQPVYKQQCIPLENVVKVA